MKQTPHRAALAALVSMGVTLATLGAAWLALAGPAAAQSSAPLKIVVGFPAGGGADALARVLADALKDELKRPVVVDNRPGAGGMIAAQQVKGQPADDATVMMVNDHMAVMVPITMKAANYTLKDFVPIAEVARYRLAFSVGPASSAATLAEHLARAKAEPAQANYGVPAPGSLPQFIGFVLGGATGAPLNVVPYRGGAPLNTDLLGGQIAASVDALGNVAEMHRQKKLRVLALTGTTRSPLMPDVPTFDELGFKGLERDGWVGFVAPSGAPTGFVQGFDAAVRKVMATDAVRARLATMGFEPVYGDARALAERAQQDDVYWGGVVRRSGFQPQ
jgi:tripartite-type tricarboxylate transporter receptor subunit TctC